MSLTLLEPTSADTGTRLPARAAALSGRVLHVINGEDYSGAERVQDLLALQLPAIGFDVAFACVLPNRFPQVREAQAAPLFRLPMRNRLDISGVPQLSRLIRREGFKLVHTHSARSALVGAPAAALAGVPVIHHMHCQTVGEARHVWLTHVNAFAERLVLSVCDAIIAVSPSLRRYLLEYGYAAEQIHLVPNGVPSCDDLTARPKEKTDWTLGTVAMFRPRKGIEVLLESLANLRAVGAPVRLRAIGRFQTESYRKEILALAEKLGVCEAVDWVGFRRNVADELRKMDIFVLPSVVNEAMPMSVLEAMATGVPVVGSSVEGITDIVRHEVDGLIVKAGDPSDLTSAVLRVIDGQVDWQQLRAAALRRQRERFSDGVMAAGVANVYRDVLARRTSSTGHRRR